jgi:putative membrane protein
LTTPPLRQPSRAIVVAIYVVSAVVYALVAFLHRLPAPGATPEFVTHLPLVNATLNGSCALLLVASLVAIRLGRVRSHARLNTTAMVISAIFLVSYVVHHTFRGSTSYGGDHRGLFLLLLLSHIVLAGVSLPMILLAYYRGWLGQIAEHRRLVRFTYPLWLYVTISGVVVYLCMAPYYR